MLQQKAKGAFPNWVQELESNEASDFENFAWLFLVWLHILKEPINQSVMSC